MTAQPSVMAPSMTWPAPGRARAQDGAHEAERHEHRAAADVAHHGRRNRRRGVTVPAVIEQPAQRHVVEVVPGRLRQRTRLAPAGQPAVHEPRIAREARLGTEAEPLHHARSEALEQRIGLLEQPQHHLGRTRLLEVDGDRALAASRDVVPRLGPERQRSALAVHQHHLGTEVGEQHAAERTGTDPGEFDDAYALERTHQSDLATISFMISSAPP
jgi:hypothetical protein